jgi:transmembrane sensor
MKPNGIKDRGAEIDRQAAEWFGRREVGLSPGQEQEFQRWLALDSRHAESYREFDETWDLLDDLRELKSSRPMAAARPERKLFSLRQAWLPAVLAAAAAIAVVLVLRPQPNPDHVRYAVTTDTAGMKKLELPDGSVIRLNANTTVTVNLDADFRRVDLQRGEAFFTVASNPARPFVVSVAGVSVRAVGTAFNVNRRTASVEVLVTEGKVRVDDQAAGRSVLPERPADGSPPLLQAGQKAVLTFPAGASPVASVTGVPESETERALAWQAKLLEFDMRPLREVVAEFNRYNQHQLVIADEELAGRVFGGTLRADNYEALVELLEDRFGVTAERSGERTILRAHQ